MQSWPIRDDWLLYIYSIDHFVFHFDIWWVGTIVGMFGGGGGNKSQMLNKINES